MFDAAARHLNFRRAAEELNLTQGAVAQQVRALEIELGRKLFDRHARGLSLTPTGRTYHAKVNQALNLLDEATRAISPKNSRITLSLPPSLASRWLVSRLADFQHQHGDIELVTSASEQLANFESDGVDVAIRHGTAPKSGNLIYEEFAPFRLIAVASPGLDPTASETSDLQDLAQHKLIEDGHNSWSALLDFSKLPIAPTMIRFNQSTLAVDAAVAGQGIALVPDILVEGELEMGKLAILWAGQRSDLSGYFIVYSNKAKRASLERQAVIDWLHAQREASYQQQ